jgi:hypothetical protein
MNVAETGAPAVPIRSPFRLKTATCEVTAVPLRHTIVPVFETEKYALRSAALDATRS